MRKAVCLLLILTGLLASLVGCNRAPAPDDPTLKNNVLTKEKASGGAGEISTLPPKPPPPGGK